MAKVARLEHEALIVETQSDAVGCVVTLGRHFFADEEGDVRLAASKRRDQLLPVRAGQFAAVEFLELPGKGNPANRTPECSHRELDQRFAVFGGEIGAEHRFGLLLDLNSKTHEITFGAVDAATAELRF